MRTLTCSVNQPLEWTLAGGSSADSEVDVLISGEGGDWRVPAFFAGDGDWCVRFAAPSPGLYRWIARSDDPGLDGQKGELRAMPYAGRNPLYLHGGLRVADDRRHFEHQDGTPFLWLGDTWWMGLTERLAWPDGFQALLDDRVRKGFSVVQIVAGLYPDMGWPDPRGRNEAGFPYDEGFDHLNTAYFDLADLKIRALVNAGIVPCVVGCWGYFVGWTGVEKMKRHWRNLVARWGAYPVVWCLAGETTMPYYLSETKDADSAHQKEAWTEIARYVREIDPMHRLVTTHPGESSRDQVSDDSLLDFDMLQTGHSGYDSIPPTLSAVARALNRKPTMPVVDGEVNYEGFLHGNNDEVQRMAFWGCLLSGAAGHTYGANGIWQVNTRETPYGPSPTGHSWGNRPWDKAMNLPGSANLGLAKRILERYRWWEFEPHQEWVSPCASESDRWGPYAAGIAGKVRVIYCYTLFWGSGPTVWALEPGVGYRATLVNPETGEEHLIGAVGGDAKGEWRAPAQPEVRDWVLILEAAS